MEHIVHDAVIVVVVMLAERSCLAVAWGSPKLLAVVDIVTKVANRCNG